MEYIGKETKSGHPDVYRPAFKFTNREIEILYKVLGFIRPITKYFAEGSQDHSRLGNMRHGFYKYLESERKRKELETGFKQN